MTSFKPTQIISYKKPQQLLPEDNIYWKRLQNVSVIQEPGQVSCVDFSPISPYNFAATCSAKVTVYDSATCSPYRILSRFKQAVYGAVYRQDGKLLVAGGEEGRVRLFDLQFITKSPLRNFKAHQGAVHCCKFSTGGKHVISFSDDQIIKYWDISTTGSVPLASFRGHNDYVRSGAASLTNESLIISGSYDHTAKVWDGRTESAVLSVDHGCPIESVLLFPNDMLFATAGGTVIKIWDISMGGNQLVQLSQHHKTITSLAFCNGYKRILSAGLDKHVKVYDTSTYQVVHSLDFPAPILSMAISADDDMFAVGTTGSNLLSVERRRPEKTDFQSKRRKRNRRNQYQLKPSEKLKSDLVVRSEERPRLQRYDNLMRRFQHSKALSDILKSSYFMERRPEVAVSVLRELNRRGALASALAGRDYSTLAPLLRFLCCYIGEQRFARVLLTVTDCLLDVYRNHVDDLDTPIVKLFSKLNDCLCREIEQQKSLTSVGDALRLILNTSTPLVEQNSTSDPSSLVFGKPTLTTIVDDNT